jgi:histidine triad (HIT) family protein
MAVEYDPENIFAKIIDGEVEVFKVFESTSALAYLDAFPMAAGHTLFIPKLKGYREFIDMPPGKASEFMRDLQAVAKAVKEATGASGINIWQNNGEDAGQTVMHPHFHIVPRTAADGLHKYPASATEKLTAEAAEPLMKKIDAVLNPPKPLKKAKFSLISTVNPESRGLNLKVKILDEPVEVESKGGKCFEVLCGDESGTVMLSLREAQKEIVAKGKSVDVRNGSVKMVKNHIRIVVDKWGKFDSSAEEVAEVNETAEKNVSATEFELVGH